jgi:hypothetical protein
MADIEPSPGEFQFFYAPVGRQKCTAIAQAGHHRHHQPNFAKIMTILLRQNRPILPVSPTPADY